MKKHLFTCFLFVVAMAVIAQNKEYETDNYKQRMLVFEQNPIGEDKVVFLGNSLTQSGKWEKYFPEIQPVNRGISGDNTEGMLARIDEVAKAKPRMLFILTGINDISQNKTNKEIIANYRKIVNIVKQQSPNTIIYIQTLLPINNDFERYKKLLGKEKQVLKLNKELKKMSKKEKVNFLNIFPLFLDDKGKLRAELTNDGLHLNEVGYAIWVEELENYLK